MPSVGDSRLTRPPASDDLASSSDADDPYSASRIVRGLAYLVGGKALTSVAGIGTFVLLVRELPVAQFAAYSILFALVQLADATTDVGIGQVLSRFVPVLHVGHRARELRRLVAIGLCCRVAVLSTFLALIWLLSPLIAPLVSLESWEWALKLYLLVILFRVMAMALFTVLESMLHQPIAQLGFGAVTVVRFLLLAAVAWRGELDLEAVILIELATDAIGCVIMLAGLYGRALRGGRTGAEGGADWMRDNARRMIRFGLKGYLQHLLIMPYGGGTNRLLVGGALSGMEMAVFGFAQSVADLMQRYLPVQLLAGVIRPVLTARYVRDNRFEDLAFAANVIFKTNAVAVCLAAAVVAGGGGEMLAFVSAGKYGDGAVGLLLLMCALVLLSSLRHMLDHVSHAVERNGPLIWSNALIALSMLPGIALLPALGVYALPAANLVGLAAGCVLLGHLLRRDGFDYRHDLLGLAWIVAAAAMGAAAGRGLALLHAHWAACAGASIAAFLLAVAASRAWSARERALLADLVRKLRRRG